MSDLIFYAALTVMRAVTTGESSDIVYKVLQLADRAMHQRTGYGLVFRITRPLNVPGDIPSIDMVTTDLGKGQALGKSIKYACIVMVCYMLTWNISCCGN